MSELMGQVVTSDSGSLPLLKLHRRLRIIKPPNLFPQHDQPWLTHATFPSLTWGNNGAITSTRTASPATYTGFTNRRVNTSYPRPATGKMVQTSTPT